MVTYPSVLFYLSSKSMCFQKWMDQFLKESNSTRLLEVRNYLGESVFLWLLQSFLCVCYQSLCAISLCQTRSHELYADLVWLGIFTYIFPDFAVMATGTAIRTDPFEQLSSLPHQFQSLYFIFSQIVRASLQDITKMSSSTAVIYVCTKGLHLSVDVIQWCRVWSEELSRVKSTC